VTYVRATIGSNESNFHSNNGPSLVQDMEFRIVNTIINEDHPAISHQGGPTLWPEEEKKLRMPLVPNLPCALKSEVKSAFGNAPKAMIVCDLILDHRSVCPLKLKRKIAAWSTADWMNNLRWLFCQWACMTLHAVHNCLLTLQIQTMLNVVPINAKRRVASLFYNLLFEQPLCPEHGHPECMWASSWELHSNDFCLDLNYLHAFLYSS